jgi:hypothetical protein
MCGYAIAAFFKPALFRLYYDSFFVKERNTDNLFAVDRIISL